VTGPAEVINWLIYAGVICAVIIIIAVSLTVMKKRKKVG
jgi:LPXTG-motif cell wall-anchored protein